MADFARLARQPCPPHEALALGLAVELGAGSPAAAQRSLEVLVRGLPEAGDPRGELDALRAIARDRLRPAPDGPALLPDVLREGRGHPLGIAVALMAVAGRAGYRVGLAGHGTRLYLAHADLFPPMVLDPGRPRALHDPFELEERLGWRCAHEAGGLVLQHVAARAERAGDLTRSLAASALLLVLPVDAASRSRQSATHQRLLSRLN